MAREDAFQVEGVIIDALTNGTYRVELPNGHRLLGFVPGKGCLSHERFERGEKVRLKLSPCDLSEGRILLEHKII